MTISLQVIYPAADEAVFDFDYYVETHLPLIEEHWGDLIETVEASRGLAGGPDVPPPYLLIATITFPDMDSLDKAMGEKGGEIIDDVANFTNVRPQILIGEVLM
ncbi:EthD family reductase [Tritonibacter horizontis]|uniref:EthD protein n=1 Tax=Tritonibacter horizontis TaxID=1768241 RepID=A0A132BVS9_9RHOB|nr:EthD family reductase [Tritonibacter horizontis]KUP91840.1 EthD protein [Tritonibacter horizontis]